MSFGNLPSNGKNPLNNVKFIFFFHPKHYTTKQINFLKNP